MCGSLAAIEHIAIICGNCEAKLKVCGTAAGRRVKCPKCDTAVNVPHIDGTPKGETGAAEQRVPGVVGTTKRDVSTAVTDGGSSPVDTRCPHCRASITTGAVICVSCGTNLQTGARHQLATAVGASRVTGDGENISRIVDGSRSLLRGCIGSGIGTALGSAAWIACALHTKHELVVLGILLGGLAGLGMHVGHRNVSLWAGLAAAIIAMVGIIAARIFIIQELFKPDVGPSELIVSAVFATGIWGFAVVGVAMFIAFHVGASGPDVFDDD